MFRQRKRLRTEQVLLAKLIKMKKVLVLLLTAYCIDSHAQSSLTIAQMVSDFDTLINNILTISPQHHVRQKVTGIDIRKNLHLIRDEVFNCKTDAAFLECVQRALNSCQDGHTSLIRTGYLPSRKDYQEAGLSDQAIDLIPRYDSLWRIDPANNRKLFIPLIYLKGEYYCFSSFSAGEKNIKAGSKLVSCNGQSIHRFVQSLLSYKRMMRWDFERKRYFAEDFFLAANFKGEDSLLLDFVQPDKKKTRVNLAFSQVLHFPDTINTSVNQTKKVEYWEKEQLLYIRVPQMSEADYYPPLIRSLAANKPVSKVVIDIRDNPGGGDGVWINILGALIKDTISYTDFILCNNTDAVKRHFPENAKDWKPYRQKDFIQNNYLIFYSGPSSIQPDSLSILYDGPIYLLQNENIYSSAGSFSAVAALSSQLISVGNNTGRLLGKGVSPLLFELPSSKILYRIEPVIDFLNVKTAADVYHDKVEDKVELSIDEYLNRLKNKNILYEKDYLLQKDPVFIKAINMKSK